VISRLLLNAHHALAQLDLVDHRRLAKALLGHPVADVAFDVLADLLEVFLGQGHGGVSRWRLAVHDHKV